eukprot:g33227.t1
MGLRQRHGRTIAELGAARRKTLAACRKRSRTYSLSNPMDSMIVWRVCRVGATAGGELKLEAVPQAVVLFWLHSHVRLQPFPLLSAKVSWEEGVLLPQHPGWLCDDLAPKGSRRAPGQGPQTIRDHTC